MFFSLFQVLSSSIVYLFVNKTQQINITSYNYETVRLYLKGPNISVVLPTFDGISTAAVYKPNGELYFYMTKEESTVISPVEYYIEFYPSKSQFMLVAYIFKMSPDYYCKDLYFSTSSVIPFKLSSYNSNQTMSNNMKVCLFMAQGGIGSIYLQYDIESNYDYSTIFTNSRIYTQTGRGGITFSFFNMSMFHFSSDYSNPSGNIQISSTTPFKPPHSDLHGEYHLDGTYSTPRLVRMTNYSTPPPSQSRTATPPTQYYTVTRYPSPSRSRSQSIITSYYTNSQPMTYTPDTTSYTATTYSYDDSDMSSAVFGIVMSAIVLAIIFICGCSCILFSKKLDHPADTTVHMLRDEENEQNVPPPPQFYQPPPPQYPVYQAPPSFGTGAGYGAYPPPPPGSYPAVPPAYPPAPYGYAPYPAFNPYPAFQPQQYQPMPPPPPPHQQQYQPMPPPPPPHQQQYQPMPPPPPPTNQNPAPQGNAPVYVAYPAPSKNDA